MDNFFMGSDISKGYCDFLVLDEKKKTIEPNFQLDDTFNGHHKLYQFFCQFFKDHPDAILHFGVESTGSYENNWLRAVEKFQSEFNIKCTRLNPAGVNYTGKSKMNRNTTDAISAKNIAEHMIDNYDKITFDQKDYFAPLRKQWTFLKMLTKQKVQLLNQLETLLYVAHPGLLVYCKNGITKKILKVILRYPSAKSLAKASINLLKEIPYMSESFAAELIDNAKKTVASAVDEITENIIQQTVTEILHKIDIIKKQSKFMAQHCSLPELELLKTFPGISDYSAIGLLIEIGSLARFTSVKHFASFFGLHPVYRKSGDGVWGMHMSKIGRKQPRAILFMVAMSAISCNPVIKHTYIENLKKGKSKMDAIGVCMHKILRIIWGMLKNDTTFDPDVDRKNREKYTEKIKQANTNRNRRYQDIDSKAPISRRQYKKRKERELSQSDLVTMYEISNPAPCSKYNIRNFLEFSKNFWAITPAPINA